MIPWKAFFALQHEPFARRFQDGDEKTGRMQVYHPFPGTNQSGSVFSTLKTEKSEHIFDGEIHILWVLKSVICTVYRDELDQVVI